MKKIVLTLCLLSFGLCVYAQDPGKPEVIIDTVKTAPDTVELKSYASRYDPRKAIMYAAILPGLGQVYNKKYWKLPLVYGGFIGFGYGISFYQKGYTKYKAELFDILETDAPLSARDRKSTRLNSSHSQISYAVFCLKKKTKKKKNIK